MKKILLILIFFTVSNTVYANGKILKEKYFENIWIQPAAGDAGGSLGAALAYWYRELDNPRKDLKDKRENLESIINHNSQRLSFIYRLQKW